MNYLTNYYKNLSEQLQAKLNNLEAQAQMLNEALTSYTVYNRNGTPTPTPDVESGDGGIPGDYNGDGLVDGADLAQALGNFGQPGYDVNAVLQNWSNQWRSSQMSGGLNAPGRGAEGAGAPGVSNMPTVGGPAGGPGRPSKAPRMSVGGMAGDAATSGKRPTSVPSVGGAAGGPGYPGVGPQVGGGAGGPGYAGPQVGGAAGGPGYAGPALPPLSDLNGDGIVDGADLGLYMGMYNAVPPGFGPNQNMQAQSWNPQANLQFVPQSQTIRRRTSR